MTTAKTATARKATTSKATAAKKTATTEAPKELKLRMTLAISLPDPAKWQLAERAEVDPAVLVEALKAQGIPADLAEQTATATVAQVGKPGVGAVRDEVKAYVVAQVTELAKLKDAGAIVTLAVAHA
jgi:hypothetical protein